MLVIYRKIFSRVLRFYTETCWKGLRRKKPSFHYIGNTDCPVILFRISDMGRNKMRPKWFTREKCLLNAIKQFPEGKCDWIIIGNCITDSTYQWLQQVAPFARIIRAEEKNAADSFRLAFNTICNLPDDRLVYMIEDDYVHRDGSLKALQEIFRSGEADYVTLYDHPDKYGYGADNPYVIGGEKTKVFLTESSHWKYSVSTTMTMAAFVHTFLRDKNVFMRWSSNGRLSDSPIFFELKNFHNRKLLLPIPSYSTHSQNPHVAKLIDWEKEIMK
ncbi:hypothetical protein [uncultured Bacteroides sp.]|uniref:hypothetical protein n=2 Tax=uncultured Bacteroides sp. TaxID=162156 RepID=UPI0027D9C3FB|nr:hypothetical protein [uncultured Bacteroides sp.]